jgi:bifunctional non-homologous end joining protein LigD
MSEIEGIRLTHPERILFPNQGVTKLALAEFYADIADWILPGLAGRPMSLLRCPRGRGEACFFQRHPGHAIDEDVPRVAIREKGGARAMYLYVRSPRDLVALVQAGTLELHVWGSRIDDLERPDAIVFDLDPGEGVTWTTVLETARSLRDRLDQLGFAGFVRTTGGKGLHVVVPLEPDAGWDEVKAFAHAVALAHARDNPRQLTVTMSKAKRRGRIFLDYLRNARGSTAIASYSTRARRGAPVAVPLRWDELAPNLASDRYGIGNLARRLGQLRSDPWAGFDDARRPVPRNAATARRR